MVLLELQELLKTLTGRHHPLWLFNQGLMECQCGTDDVDFGAIFEMAVEVAGQFNANQRIAELIHMHGIEKQLVAKYRGTRLGEKLVLINQVNLLVNPIFCLVSVETELEDQVEVFQLSTQILQMRKLRSRETVTL